MKHADVLAERVLFLDGLPNFQAINRLKVGETVEEILKADLALEMEAIPLLKEAIAHCEGVRDYVSREIFERILESEEEHVDFLETQFEMIERMGLANYVQLQSAPAGEGGGVLTGAGEGVDDPPPHPASVAAAMVDPIAPSASRRVIVTAPPRA